MSVVYHNAGALFICLLLGILLMCAVFEIENGKPSAVLLKGLRVSNNGSCKQQLAPSVEEKVPDVMVEKEKEHKQKIKILVEMWSSSSYLKEGSEISDLELSQIPRPPHMENCKERAKMYTKLDARDANGNRPQWTLWKGLLGSELGKHVPTEDNGEKLLLNKKRLLQGPFPPWIDGGEEDNLPMTRRVQRDIWLNQHPKNCRDPSQKFLFIDFGNIPEWGTGTQLNAISQMVGVAMKERRVLVLNVYNRADHEGCKGPTRARWTCYFIAETSEECRKRALELASDPRAKKNRTLTDYYSYPASTTWFDPTPELWGRPWENIQATSQVNGELIVHHQQMNIWWWRAQVIRYLMRYPSEYLCTLLNRARHEAFGEAAAAVVIKTLPKEWPKASPPVRNVTSIEKLVWSNHKHRPWIPRPMVSVHVRQGDKAREMKLFDFKSYMQLAQNLRGRFPQAEYVWLSTEMQNVIDESKNYKEWTFYHTNITRQNGTTTMKDYENGLGRLKSSNNAFVNLMMAIDCDYFIGALGSSWGSVIDGLRSTGGKTLAGMVSVNPGQFW